MKIHFRIISCAIVSVLLGFSSLSCKSTDSSRESSELNYYSEKGSYKAASKEDLDAADKKFIDEIIPELIEYGFETDAIPQQQYTDRKGVYNFVKYYEGYRLLFLDTLEKIRNSGVTVKLKFSNHFGISRLVNPSAIDPKDKNFLVLNFSVTTSKFSRYEIPYFQFVHSRLMVIAETLKNVSDDKDILIEVSGYSLRKGNLELKEFDEFNLLIAQLPERMTENGFNHIKFDDKIIKMADLGIKMEFIEGLARLKKFVADGSIKSLRWKR